MNEVDKVTAKLTGQPYVGGRVYVLAFGDPRHRSSGTGLLIERNAVTGNWKVEWPDGRYGWYIPKELELA